MIVDVMIADGCTIQPNWEIEPNYLTKTDIQLNPNILKIRNDKKIL